MKNLAIALAFSLSVIYASDAFAKYPPDSDYTSWIYELETLKEEIPQLEAELKQANEHLEQLMLDKARLVQIMTSRKSTSEEIERLESLNENIAQQTKKVGDLGKSYLAKLDKKAKAEIEAPIQERNNQWALAVIIGIFSFVAFMLAKGLVYG